MDTMEQTFADTMAETISNRVMAKLRPEIAEDATKRHKEVQGALDAIEENWTLRFQTHKAETKAEQSEFEKLVNERLGVAEAENRKLVQDELRLVKHAVEGKVKEIAGEIFKAQEASKTLTDLLERSESEYLRVKKSTAAISMVGALVAGIGGTLGSVRLLENHKLKKAGHTREDLKALYKPLQSERRVTRMPAAGVPAAPAAEPVTPRAM